jgi:DNA-binding Xre family transcriptional regulator
MARRRLNFHWHLRRVMAAHDIWQTTQLVPLLRERGVELSATQVYRLVTDKPERLSLRTLTALCDIFDCSPADLIEPYIEAAGRKQKAEGATVIDVSPNLRPKRARILDDK